jgi:soluble epoxide hydrolase / lipid-phosphate phosphatase
MLHSDRCAGLITLAVALMAPSGDGFDVDAVNKLTEQAYGYPLFAYWEFFLPLEGAKAMEDHLEACWHVWHGADDDWMFKMFCVRGAMKEFVENDRRVELKPYAQDKAFRDQWINAKKEGGMVAPTNWYRAMAHGYQIETESKLNGKVEKPYLFIGCSGDKVCRTDAIEGPKRAGLVPDCTVKEIESGHWLTYEKPDETAAIMVDWLKEKGFVG